MKMIETEEHSRIDALRSLQILDTAPQDCFDRITGLCRQIFDCSVALISLVDEDRQWFLSAQGVDVTETPREYSFCAHALTGGRALLVSDALEDDRFSASPLVVAGPRLRSYLGQPLATRNRHLIGTLCVADTRPERFDEKDVAALRILAKTVEDLIEAHAQRKESAHLAAHLEDRSARIEEANRVFRQAEKTAKIGSWELDLETGALHYSEQALEILGYKDEERLTLEKVLDRYVAEDRSRVEGKMAEVIETRGSSSLEVDFVTFDGQRKHLMVVGEYLDGGIDRPARLVGIFQDISEGYHARLALERAADRDALTGLFNRHAFDRILGERMRLQRASDEDFFVLLIDLDGFKDVNDTFGHLLGDAVLEEISARISDTVPEGATAARWGGDEFAVITPVGTSLAGARKIGSRLIKVIGAQVAIADRRIDVSATCGMARSDDVVSAREFMRRADLALYHGKSREPGRVHAYDATLESANRLRQDAISKVRNALHEDRLFAGYQPIVELETSTIVGFEALMRLNTRAGESVTAHQVMPALLDPALSREIGERMLSQICSEFSEIEQAQPGIKFVSINATEADLLSRNYAGRLLTALDCHRIRPNQVTLEVTETMLLVNDAQTVQLVLSRLRNCGMKIALDDFGTGFSSLSHLRDFPIDKVKIDGSFVQKMCHDHQTRLIVQALIGMARNLGIEVIAEGIESEEQRDLLLKMGCNYGQGFLFSPAETACRLKLLKFGSSVVDERSKAA